MNFWNGCIDSAKFLLTYKSKRVHCSHRPLVVMIEPTNNCDIECTMCVQHKMSREKGYMPFALYKKIIEHNYNYIRHLELYLLGEPLLHPQICEMIGYARKFKIWTRIYTNGVSLSEELSKKLILSGPNAVTFSFEGLNKEYYENIRKGASYEEVLANIQKFVSIKRTLKKKYPYVSVEFVKFNVKPDEIKPFVVKMKRLGADRVDGVPCQPWPIDERNKNVTPTSGMNDKRKYYGCFMPWTMVSVLWTGKVIGCCKHYNGAYSIGNFNETPYLSEMWNGQGMITLRKKLVNREYSDLPHCRNCSKLWQPNFKHSLFENALWSLKERLRIKL